MSGSLRVYSLPRITPKVAPSFEGGTAWSAYAEAINDWLDITTLTLDKVGAKPKSQTGLEKPSLTNLSLNGRD